MFITLFALWFKPIGWFLFCSIQCLMYHHYLNMFCVVHFNKLFKLLKYYLALIVTSFKHCLWTQSFPHMYVTNKSYLQTFFLFCKLFSVTGTAFNSEKAKQLLLQSRFSILILMFVTWVRQKGSINLKRAHVSCPQFTV